MMKVLHFILGKAAKDRANGVNQVIAGLAKYCARMGADIEVLGKAESVDHEGETIVRDGFVVQAYSRWNAALRSSLREKIAWANIVHLHGVYSPWNIMVAKMCLSAGRPYIVTLHDGLSPERSRSRLKKKIFHNSLQRRFLERAAGVHVLTEEESTDLFTAAHPGKVFCIPNGVDLEDFPVFRDKQKPRSERAAIGYLGRLSPEKNLESLCQAFCEINVDGRMKLKLAGPHSSYGNRLLDRYSSKGVELVGPKFGGDKFEFIRSLDLFVHPSLCDGFSIAAMEVLALGTPLLITRTSKTSYFYDRDAFFMCEPTSFGLEVGLRAALSQRSGWSAKAGNGWTLINDRLNWQASATDMLQAYSRVINL